MIRDSGWCEYSIWEHSASVRELYARRCREESEEMTCAAQAAEILATLAAPGDSVLDAGCGSGYFFHSLRRRKIPVTYLGIDAAPSLIAIGQQVLPAYGLDPEHLRTLRIEDLTGSADHVLCMNVLSNIDNYHRPLERLLKVARKTVILRESFKEGAAYSYVRDRFLDSGVDLRVYVNAYDKSEVAALVSDYGFTPQWIEDRRTRGQPEMVIGHPHYWTFLLAQHLA